MDSNNKSNRVMNRIRQAAVWLSRITHCHGFGVQSPADYRLVRYVINEHWPYYAYDEVGKSDNWLRRKLGRLYMRLANDRQSDAIVDLVGYGEYLNAGCRKSNIVSTTPDRIGPSTMVIAQPDVAVDIVALCQADTLLVVHQPYSDKQRWHQILQHNSVNTTFDLYYCGLVFFDTTRPNHHYTINF